MNDFLFFIETNCMVIHVKFLMAVAQKNTLKKCVLVSVENKTEQLSLIDECNGWFKFLH